jgi:hypothetical protein
MAGAASPRSVAPMASGISMGARREVLASVAKRYQTAGRAEIRDADFDNDSAFLNDFVVPWCRAQKIEVTRSLAYKNTDVAIFIRSSESMAGLCRAAYPISWSIPALPDGLLSGAMAIGTWAKLAAPTFLLEPYNSSLLRGDQTNPTPFLLKVKKSGSRKAVPCQFDGRG